MSGNKTISPDNGDTRKSKLVRDREMLDELYGDGTRNSWRKRLEPHIKTLQQALYADGWRQGVTYLWDALQYEVYGKKEAIERGFVHRHNDFQPTTKSLAGKIKKALLLERLPDDENFIAAINDALAKHFKRKSFDVYDFLTGYSERKQQERKQKQKGGVTMAERQKPEESARQVYRSLLELADSQNQEKSVPPEEHPDMLYVGLPSEVNEHLRSTTELSEWQWKTGRKWLCEHGLLSKEGLMDPYFIAPHDSRGQLNTHKRVYRALERHARKQSNAQVKEFSHNKRIVRASLVGVARNIVSPIEDGADVTASERQAVFNDFRDLGIIFIEGNYRTPSYRLYLSHESEIRDILIEEGILNEDEMLNIDTNTTQTEQFVAAIRELAGDAVNTFENEEMKVSGQSFLYSGNAPRLADLLGWDLNRVTAIKHYVLTKGHLYEYSAGNVKHLIVDPEITLKEGGGESVVEGITDPVKTVRSFLSHRPSDDELRVARASIESELEEKLEKVKTLQDEIRTLERDRKFIDLLLNTD